MKNNHTKTKHNSKINLTKKNNSNKVVEKVSETIFNTISIEAEPIYFKKIYWVLLVLLFVLYMTVNFSYGVSGDERLHVVYGNEAIKYYKSWGKDTSLFNLPIDIDPAQNIKYYGSIFSFASAALAKFTPWDDYTADHVFISLVAFIGIFFLSRIILLCFNYSYAILGLLLFSFSPYFLGHAFNNPKDVPFASLYIISLFYIIKVFDAYPQNKKIDYLWLSLAIGLNISLRVGGILLYPYILVFIVLKIYYQSKLKGFTANIFKYWKPFAIIFISSYLITILTWPYAWQKPIDNMVETLKLMTNFNYPILQLFDGKKMYPSENPWFLPLNLLYTNSLPVVLGFVIGSMGLIILFLKRKIKYFNKPVVLLFMFFTTVFPVMYIIYKKSTIYHAWRHELFIIGGIIFMACFGWYLINQLMANKLKTKFKYWGLTLGFFLMIEPLSFFIKTFPYTNSYYNLFVGGTAKAYGRYEMDSYGNSLKNVSEYFIKNVVPTLKPDSIYTLATNFPQIVKIYISPEKHSQLKNINIIYVRPTEKNDKLWDYAIMHSVVNMPPEELQTLTWLPSKTIFEAKVEGKPLCILYKRPSFDDYKGFEYMNKNNADSAILYFKKYLLIEPKDVNVINSLGNIYYSLGNINEAENYVHTTLSIQPQNYAANFIMGLSRLRQNKFAMAIDNFKILTEQNRYNFDAFYYLGYCYYQTKNFQEAYNSLSNVYDGQYKEASQQLLNDISKQLP